MQTLLEPNKKTTLVVDGNWLLISRQFVMRDIFKKELPIEYLEQSSYKLADMMCQSISTTLRLFRGLITNVVLVADNKSWRRDIPKPPCIQGVEYKGNREFESNTDWNYVWKAMDILIDRLNAFGVTTCRLYGIEGDDWCWWWSRKLNAQGINVITWTSDNDVKQLIQKDNDTGAWTGWYEKSKGLYLNERCKCGVELENLFDSFMSPIIQQDSSISKFTKVVPVTYYNPAEIVNSKIFIGDEGDNIRPTFTYKKGEKTYKMTLKDLTGLINIEDGNYDESDWEKSLNYIYKNILLKKKSGLKNSTNITTEKEFIEHVIYNRQMVWINEKMIPDYIQEQMSQVEYKQLSHQAMYDMMMNWKSMTTESDSDVSSLVLDEMFG